MDDPDGLSYYSLIRSKLLHHLEFIYPGIETSSICDDYLAAMRLDESVEPVHVRENLWDESDIIAITYANSICTREEKPLLTLRNFFNEHLASTISGIHLLPFFPYSSDDGFAVVDYEKVDPAMGDWSDVEKLSQDYDLMADLVINHCSAQHQWFSNFIDGVDPGRDYFFTADPSDDLRSVVRPRTSELLQAVDTHQGRQYVWCTFSHDQVDLDFTNPKVLLEFIRILRFYLDNGIRIFRLDAVAFLWKEVGNHCLNLHQTHEIVRLLRLLIEHANPRALVITETNIPNQENLSYFGNANEAHCVYNFPLPPLLVHALISGNCTHLNNWFMSLPQAQDGTAYFNFIASHDGIGLRPTEGFLNQEELTSFLETMEDFGALISWRDLKNFVKKPYEVNISLFDALKGTIDGADEWQVERFMCAHAIMLAMQGIPGIYIHSLLATPNDYQRVAATGNNRAINRHQWNKDELEKNLSTEGSRTAVVLNRMKELIGVRRAQPAFHPNANKHSLHTGDRVFSFWRQSQDRQQIIYCLHNVSKEPQSVFLMSMNLIGALHWQDLITGTRYRADDTIHLQPYQYVWLRNEERRKQWRPGS